MDENVDVDVDGNEDRDVDEAESDFGEWVTGGTGRNLHLGTGTLYIYLKIHCGPRNSCILLWPQTLNL